MVFNNGLVIAYGIQTPRNTFLSVTLPYTYKKYFNVVHGGGDTNSITWVMTYKDNLSTIRIGSRGTQSWSYTTCFYLTIGV